jgi:biopolymer transport protein ExbD
MKLILPKDTDKPEEQNKVKASGALTLMLSKNNTIYYYEGELMPDGSNFKSTNFKEVRDIIINKKKNSNPEDFVVVIKPGPESTYKNTVDVLDEMTINEVKRYAMVDLFAIEQQLINASEGGAPMPQPGAAAPAAAPAAGQ